MLSLSERIRKWRHASEGWYLAEHEQWADEVAQLEEELAQVREDWKENFSLYQMQVEELKAENERLSGGQTKD